MQARLVPAKNVLICDREDLAWTESGGCEMSLEWRTFVQLEVTYS